MTTGWPRFLPRWLCFVGLWLLLSIVFASQLYWAGSVKPWTRAFWQEAVYWFSWGIISPMVFWLCRRLHNGPREWQRYLIGLTLGAALASVSQTTIGQSIRFGKGWLDWRLSASEKPPAPLLSVLPGTAVRASGWNMLIFGATVLGWHAAAYYRELRDRQLKAVELESLLHQAQLQTLRSQLNPHFLFNTLHSMAELVHENPALAEQLIVRLGELLRKVLQSSATQEVSLAEELDFVKGYVEIEQMRLGDRLEVNWEVAPETLEARVPGFILQPLVENAIQHGIAPLDRPGKLLIRSRRADGVLHLQVRDSGPGLPQDKEACRSGVGLSNTAARLQRLYGDRHRFELKNDHGLVVDLQLPMSPPTQSEPNQPMP